MSGTDAAPVGAERPAVLFLADRGHDAVHVGDIGLHQPDDDVMLAEALRQGRIVVTLDADFHAYLAITNATGPSVIRIRREGLRGQELADLLETVIARCRAHLEQGALLSVRAAGIGVRGLPLRR
jgi:predicted nuclease of predicted toxin-antitoxin system